MMPAQSQQSIDMERAVRRLTTPERLRAFFSPRTVALVGASESSAWARNVHHGLKLSGFREGIVVVNPGRKDVFGCETVPSLRDWRESVDLAYLFVGPENVDAVLADAAACGVRNAVVLAAGFGETGAEGAARQKKLVQRAVELNMTLLGPNSLGFVNPAVAAPYGSGLRGPLLRGPVGFVLQSGSLTSALIPFATGRGTGCSLLAAVGNEAVISSMDVFELLLGDEKTQSIALFLETVREPHRFMALSRRALELGKPVTVLKAGRSEAGKRAAMAHTGAMASDDAVVDAAFRQSGVVRVSGLEELVVTAGLLGYQRRLPRGRRMGVVTSSGGGSNLIADKAAEEGFTLPEFSPATAVPLRAALPPFASVQNPLDVTGFWMNTGGSARVLKPEDEALQRVAADPGMDLVVHVMTALPNEKPADPAPAEARIEALAQVMRDAPVPTFTTTLANLPLETYPRELLDRCGIHLLGGVDLALTAIGHATRWNEGRERILAQRAYSAAARTVSAPLRQGAWSEHEAREWLASAGVPVVPAALVGNAEEAVAAAEKLGWPVVVKLCSAEVPHKSDIGGVVLRVASADAVRAAFARVMAAAPGRKLDGALISPMRAQGVEMLVGVTRDPTFGPVLTVGLGGIWVELLHDVALRVLPVGPAEVRAMLEQLRGVALLKGLRGGMVADLDRLSGVILAIAEAALSLGNRLEAVEVNPLLVREDGMEALDALVITTEG
jgi:acyl-CoA synthetase (NDP forming)